jgi:hypothetical protein
MNLDSRLAKVGLAGAGVLAGAVLAGALSAQAATTPPSQPSTSSRSTAAEDPHPGDNGADGIPEAQEHHGGRHGHGLGLSGTVTAVGSASVTIKTATATTEYAVTTSSDIDKNGEAALSDLAVGDVVTFSVDATKTTRIDKLHAGDEAKNMPQGKATAPESSRATASSSAAATNG